MGSLRFLLTRRWVLFFVVVALLTWLAWALGGWQFDRLHERQDRNGVIERNEAAPPAPVEELMAPGGDVGSQDQWRRVEATGTYDVEDTVIVRYRTREGQAGVNVVVPLETGNGPSLLVDRGWVATTNRGASVADVPAPPEGEVTVVGWLRSNATGSSTSVADNSTRAISSTEIAEAQDREVYGGFVDVASESPAPEVAPEPAGLPELGQGPHFFYGLQWWFFGLLAVVGFGYLAYDEWRGPRPGGKGPRTPRGPRPPRRSNHPDHREPAAGAGTTAPGEPARGAPVS